jgi:pilus assembly protein CpaB
MKWSIAGLLLFGLVAATSAAVLVASLQAGSRPQPSSGTVEFLVAASDLPRSKIVSPGSLATRKTPRAEMPEGALTNAVQVVGKVLAVPMVEGQPFTRTCFASEGSGFRVASVLPDGMRAMTLALVDYAGLHGLLYPGCTVDVLSAFRCGTSTRQSEALSKVLLEDVQVLAVEHETLVSGTETAEGKRRDGQSQSRTKRLLVTLMVDLEQAAALQLAMQHGNVSLALRNPLDKAPASSEGVRLSQVAGRGVISDGGQPESGSGPGFGSFLQAMFAGLAAARPAPAGPAAAPASASPAPAAAEARAPAAGPQARTGPAPHPRSPGEHAAAQQAAAVPASALAQATPNAPRWIVTILRGGVATERSLPLPPEPAETSAEETITEEAAAPEEEDASKEAPAGETRAASPSSDDANGASAASDKPAP